MSLVSFLNAAIVSVVRVGLRFLPVFLVLFGCDACGSTPGEPRESPSDPEVGRGSSTDPAAPGTPADSLRVIVRGEPKEGGVVAIVIENHAEEPVSLSRRIVVEQRTGDSFHAVEVARLTLRPSCDREAPECVALVPGAELYPPDWLGTAGDAQCECTRCAPVDAGTYRFVLTTCHGARVEGEIFHLRR